MLAMAAVNLGLNLWLIPLWGVLGAAVSTLLALSLGTVGSAWCGRRTGVYPGVLGDLVKAVLVGAALAWALRFTAAWSQHPLGMVARLVVSFALFGGLAWALNLSQLRALCRAWAVRLRPARRA
jgi:O-antigen/teichoic acid export membrane protein